MSKVIQDAKRRIEQVRKKDVELLVIKDGNPVENASVSFRMKNHDFLFGAVCYKYGTYDTKEMNDLFTKEFTKLFNYTMMPYHWNWYEPEYRKYNEPYTSNLIRWAQSHNIKRKLHAFIWDWFCPDWVTFNDDVKQRYTERISHLMANFGDDFDFFDVANEITVNGRYDSPLSRWIDDFGRLNTVKFGTELVRSFKPDAKLLYGDFNIHVDAYYDFLRDMRDNDVDIDILGLQSHMHTERWTLEHTLDIMDRVSAFGWPLHFPECSVCSGKPAKAVDHTPGAVNEWIENDEDLYSQAEFARDFYTIIFSHPATEALSWFDFTDHRWLGAPAGVVTEDLKIKPIYNTLYDLIHREWHTDADVVTGASGICTTRLFFGNYDITVDVNGEKKTVNRDISRKSFYSGGGEPRRLVVKI